MGRMFSIILVILATVAPAHARSLVTIQVDKERRGQYQSSRELGTRGSIQSTDMEVWYRITLRAASAAVPESAKVEWFILVRGFDGALYSGGHGLETVRFTKETRQVVLRTAPIQFSGSSWRSPGRSGSLENSIYGYGVRVTDENGLTLAEKLSPPRIEKSITWSVVPPESSPATPAPTTTTVPMPVIYSSEKPNDK